MRVGEVPVEVCGEVLQLKVWLLHVSPMIWRRFQVPTAFTLRQVYGVIQVGMGWEGIYLFQFCLRAAHFGSFDLCVDSPNITLAELQLRKGTRFLYEYELDIPWCHEVRARPSWKGSLEIPTPDASAVKATALLKIVLDGPISWVTATPWLRWRLGRTCPSWSILPMKSCWRNGPRSWTMKRGVGSWRVR